MDEAHHRDLIPCLIGGKELLTVRLNWGLQFQFVTKCTKGKRKKERNQGGTYCSVVELLASTPRAGSISWRSELIPTSNMIVEDLNSLAYDAMFPGTDLRKISDHLLCALISWRFHG